MNPLIDRLQKEVAEVSIFSNEYFFNAKYQKHRNQTNFCFDGYDKKRTVLSFLIREGMREESRQTIFKSKYDLGNLLDIPGKYCTYDALVSELYSDRSESINGNDAFETIQKAILEITGKKVLTYSKKNKSKTFKVLKLLKSIMKESENQWLMRLIRSPVSEKFSFSFRELDPYFRNQEQVFLIADLSAHLSAELSDDCFFSIRNFFDSLVDRCTTIYNQVDLIVTSNSKSVDECIASFQSVSSLLERIECEYVSLDLDLDEELFLHITRLEFAHFAVGIAPLIKAATPVEIIRPVYSELVSFLRLAFPCLSADTRVIDPLLSIKNVPEFLLRWQSEINEIVKLALPKEFTIHSVKKILVNVQNLIRFYYAFGSTDSVENYEDKLQVSVWNVVAAVCSVNYSLNCDMSFAPYWQGQEAQGGSINRSLSMPFFGNDSSIDHVPEEHRRIWLHLYAIVGDAMRDQLKLRVEKHKFLCALFGTIHKLCKSNNLKAIEKNLKFVEILLPKQAAGECNH